MKLPGPGFSSMLPERNRKSRRKGQRTWRVREQERSVKMERGYGRGVSIGDKRLGTVETGTGWSVHMWMT